MHVISLKPTNQSVRTARDFAAGFLDNHAVGVREIVTLLVSELVSNAVRHGGPHGPTATVSFEVVARPDCVRVGVTDGGTGDPLLGDGAIHRPSGRGLLLVEALASRWGYDRSPDGKTVWFELLISTGDDADG